MKCFVHIPTLNIFLERVSGSSCVRTHLEAWNSSVFSLFCTLTMTQVRQHPSQPLRKAVAPVLAQIVRPDQVCHIVHRRYCATPPLNGQNAPSPARNAFPGSRRAPSRRCVSHPRRRAAAPVLAQIGHPDRLCRLLHRRYHAVAPSNGQNGPSPVRNGSRHVTPGAVAPLRRRRLPAVLWRTHPCPRHCRLADYHRLRPRDAPGRPAGVCDAHIPRDRARWAPVDARAHRATLSSPPL